MCDVVFQLLDLALQGRKFSLPAVVGQIGGVVLVL
jgi:hypothetical protein